jgi:hypothetical protein
LPEEAKKPPDEEREKKECRKKAEKKLKQRGNHTIPQHLSHTSDRTLFDQHPCTTCSGSRDPRSLVG